MSNFEALCGQRFLQTSLAPIEYFDSIYRIVGGMEADKWEFPWLVSLQLKENGVNEHYCGGSIISDNYILTAAHCVYG